MKWADLSPKQKALGLKRWHAKQDGQTSLSPDAKQALAHKKALSEEVAPGLTRGDLLAQVRSGTRQKFGESEAALGDSFRQNQLQTARTSDWYGQYKSAINQAAQQQAAQNQAAVQGVQNLQQGLNADSAQQWAGQSAQMTGDAASRGATVNPQLADQAHNASNIRGMLTGSYGAMLLNQGNAQQSDLSNRAATSVQQRNEALAGKQSERAGLQRERRRLKQQKGDFKVTYRAQLKSDASRTALSSALTEAQLAQAGVKIQETKAGIANKNANTQKTQVETTKTALENAYFAKYGKYPSTGARALTALEKYRLNYAKTHGGKFPGTESTGKGGSGSKTDPASGPGSLTGSTEQKRVSQVRTVSSLFRNGVVVKDNTGAVLRRIKGGDVAAIRQYLLTEKALDPLAVQIGLALFKNKGKLGRGGVAAAHRYGIHVGGNFDIVPHSPASGVSGSTSAGGG